MKISENPEMFPSASYIREGYRYCVHSAHTIFSQRQCGNCKDNWKAKIPLTILWAIPKPTFLSPPSFLTF
jgi:hypothetical protein